MTPVHVHLLLNHVPVIGTIFGLLLLLTAIARKSEELKKAALTVFVLSAILAIPVYLSGEPSEDQVEKLPGVSKAIIEEHEDSAKWALAAAELLGLVALIGLFKPSRKLIFVCLALSMIAGMIIARTAYLGGQIRHSEIRSGATDQVQHNDSDEQDGD